MISPNFTDKSTELPTPRIPEHVGWQTFAKNAVPGARMTLKLNCSFAYI